MVIGLVIAVGTIALIQDLSQKMYAPHANVDWGKKDEVRAFVSSLPMEAFVMVLVSYALGTFLGGSVAALIASRWRIFHAGFIGSLVLAATIGNFAMMKYQMHIDHPDWMILVGLLQPLPVSLIAGAIVSKLVQGRNP
jgi:hypothetical protein